MAGPRRRKSHEHHAVTAAGPHRRREHVAAHAALDMAAGLTPAAAQPHLGVTSTHDRARTLRRSSRRRARPIHPGSPHSSTTFQIVTLRCHSRRPLRSTSKRVTNSTSVRITATRRIARQSTTRRHGSTAPRHDKAKSVHTSTTKRATASPGPHLDARSPRATPRLIGPDRHSAPRHLISFRFSAPALDNSRHHASRPPQHSAPPRDKSRRHASPPLTTRRHTTARRFRGPTQLAAASSRAVSRRRRTPLPTREASVLGARTRHGTTQPVTPASRRISTSFPCRCLSRPPWARLRFHRPRSRPYQWRR